MSSIEATRKRTVFTINRLETLTDGVFAIAMTLLVLNLTIPVITSASVQAELPRKILELWPKFLSYFVSFIILGIFWLSHHRIFRLINSANATLMWLNIFFLLFVALIPFSTALAGDYIMEQFPFLVYGVNLLPVFILRYALWAYASGKHRLVDNDINPLLVKRLNLLPVIACLIVLLAIGISFLNTWAGYSVFILMLVYGVLSQRLLRIE